MSCKKGDGPLSIAMQYWLMKSEPEVFSIFDLEKKKTVLWDGVRNYQARNFMMNDMDLGDLVLFYHSNATPAGVAGIARVSKVASVDPSQFDKKSEYFDPKSTKENPRWFCVEVEFVQAFKTVLSLDEMRADPALEEMLVLKRGQRLSVQPVKRQHFEHILKLKTETLAPSLQL